MSLALIVLILAAGIILGVALAQTAAHLRHQRRRGGYLDTPLGATRLPIDPWDGGGQR